MSSRLSLDLFGEEAGMLRSPQENYDRNNFFPKITLSVFSVHWHFYMICSFGKGERKKKNMKGHFKMLIFYKDYIQN